MEQLISFIEKIYEKNQLISGRLHIYNLFNLQNAKSENAIYTFEELVSSGEYDINESLVTLNELCNHPWILLGWGVKREKRWKNPQRIKGKWSRLIEESMVPTFGKKHEKNNDYYHPCPLIPTKRPLMIEELISKYKHKFKKNQECQKRYSLLKWNGEFGTEERFIVRDNLTSRQSLFIPGRCANLFWFHSDLASDQVVSNWCDFRNESFDDLELRFFKDL